MLHLNLISIQLDQGFSLSSTKLVAWRIVGPQPTSAEWMGLGVEMEHGDLVELAPLWRRSQHTRWTEQSLGSAHGDLTPHLLLLRGEEPRRVQNAGAGRGFGEPHLTEGETDA